MDTGTVAEIAQQRWGIALTGRVQERFTKDGWYYEEQVARPCHKCNDRLHSLRKPGSF